MIVTWEVDDGYVGGSRPHNTVIDDEELAELETKAEKEEFITNCIQEDFEQRICWHEIRRES